MITWSFLKGSKNIPSASPEQGDFLAWQVILKAYLPNEQESIILVDKVIEIYR